MVDNKKKLYSIWMYKIDFPDSVGIRSDAKNSLMEFVKITRVDIVEQLAFHLQLYVKK